MAYLKRKTKQIKKIKGNAPPKWFTIFSNKILPPIFFLFLAILALHYIPSASSTPLRINLGVISVAASSLSVYLAILMF